MTAGRTRRSPGWYQDPDDPTRVRHWNGRGWTGRRRPRPTWHVLPNDLAPDPNWVSPGGIDGATLRELLGGPDANPAGEIGGRDQRGAGGHGDRPFGLEGPPFEDPRGGLRGRERPYVEDPLGGNARDKPMHAEGPAHDWSFRSERYRTDRYRTGFRSSWASAAAFGEPRRAPRPGGPGSHFGGRPAYGSPLQPAGPLQPLSWRRSRVPLILVVGLTLFAVVALLINLGTTARGRFSAVSVDATFIGQANVACATALGSGRLGSKTVMTSGTAAGGTKPTGTVPRSAPSSTGVTPTAAGGSGAHQGGQVVAPTNEQLTRLTTLEGQLGSLHPTPAAAPQVKGWLADWQRYLADERSLQQDETARDTASASLDMQKAHVAAADADLFAADNGLSACAIDSGAKAGFEPIP